MVRRHHPDSIARLHHEVVATWLKRDYLKYRRRRSPWLHRRYYELANIRELDSEWLKQAGRTKELQHACPSAPVEPNAYKSRVMHLFEGQGHPMWCLTPKLSRPAQWSGAHGRLSLPCGPRNEAGSACMMKWTPPASPHGLVGHTELCGFQSSGARRASTGTMLRRARSTWQKMSLSWPSAMARVPYGDAKVCTGLPL